MKCQQTLGKTSGFVRSQTEALIKGGASGNYNAGNILQDNLGNALVEGVMTSAAQVSPESASMAETKDIIEVGGYCPIPESETIDAKPRVKTFEDMWEERRRMQQLMGVTQDLPLQEWLQTSTGKSVSTPSPSSDIITANQLSTMFPKADKDVLNSYLPEFNSQLNEAGINTPKRLAYFFATVNEETGGMTKFSEDFHYKPDRAKSMFGHISKWSDQQIKALGSGELFANTVYAHINGNGNISSGDGYLYRGRGLFQYTGRDNYRQGLVKDPHFLQAVHLVNPGYAGLNKRAKSYNQYISIFE